MTNPPKSLKNIDSVKTDAIVRRHLKTAYLDHPTRGPYVTSKKLFEEVKEDIDERFTVELFGVFCEHCSYLEKWSRTYNGSYRYKILQEHF